MEVGYLVAWVLVTWVLLLRLGAHKSAAIRHHPRSSVAYFPKGRTVTTTEDTEQAWLTNKSHRTVFYLTLTPPPFCSPLPGGRGEGVKSKTFEKSCGVQNSAAHPCPDVVR